MERIRNAVKQFRRNRRELRRARGLSTVGFDREYMPLGDERVFDGVDATPEELVIYAESRFHRERSKVGLLTNWALTGLATEMAMHETNSMLSNMMSCARRFASVNPNNHDIAYLEWAAKRLYDNFNFLSRFKASGPSNYNAKPETILKKINHEFALSIKREDLAIETTDAFLNSSFRGEERVMCAVFNNLVRNAMQWSYQAGNKKAIVRFDARTIEFMGEDWDEDTETVVPALRRTDIILVEDNGPGVDPGLGDDIFEPSVSGRGSSGIGLHLCRAVLEAHGQTVVLSEDRSELGGAIFLVGSHARLRPINQLPSSDRPRELELVDALHSMIELIRNGHNAEATELSDVYEEAAGVAMRIRLQGAENTIQERLLEAVDAFEEALRAAPPINQPTAPKP